MINETQAETSVPMAPSSSRPPEYGSPEWQALAKDDPQRKEAVLFAADCWRLLMASPHAESLLVEWVEWMYRRTMREASWAISEAEDWTAVASLPTYAELRKRRQLVAVLPCAVPDCDLEVTYVHPLEDWQATRLPDTSWARCPRHVGVELDLPVRLDRGARPCGFKEAA